MNNTQPSRTYLAAIFDQISKDRSEIIARIRDMMRLKSMPQAAITDTAILNGHTLAVLEDIEKGIMALRTALENKPFDEVHALIKQGMSKE